VSCADHDYGRGVLCLSCIIYVTTGGQRSPWRFSRCSCSSACTTMSVELTTTETTRYVRVWCDACAKRSGLSAPVRGEVLTPEQRRPAVFIHGDRTAVGRRFPRFAPTPRPRLRHGCEITSGCTTSNGKLVRDTTITRRTRQWYHAMFPSTRRGHNRELEQRTSPSFADRFTWPASDLELLCYAI